MPSQSGCGNPVVAIQAGTVFAAFDVIWPQDGDGTQFVPLAEWREMYERTERAWKAL